MELSTSTTGMPFSFAFCRAGMTAFASIGLTTSASTPAVIRSSIWVTCVATPVSEPAVTSWNLQPASVTSFSIASAIACWNASLVTVFRLKATVYALLALIPSADTPSARETSRAATRSIPKNFFMTKSSFFYLR